MSARQQHQEQCQHDSNTRNNVSETATPGTMSARQQHQEQCQHVLTNPRNDGLNVTTVS